jgi:4-hydroxy-tetrahydrodipicolinate synthase
MFKKSNVALVTPFKDGQIDIHAFEELLRWQIDSGTNGVIICGSTGEGINLNDREREQLIKASVAIARGKIPIMIGTGTSSTEQTISFTRQAKDLGADAALVVAPYYNKPTQEGIYQHFKAVNDAVDLPIFIYNNPGRAVVNINDDTVVRIAQLKNVVGIKDSPLDMSRPIRLANALVNDNFSLLTGEDLDAIAYNAHGGMGIISVTGNVAPALSAELQDLCAQGKFAAALKLQKKLMPLHQAMFCETNPIPVKYALSLLGKARAEVRLPLTELQPASKQKVEKAMKDLGLI